MIIMEEQVGELSLNRENTQELLQIDGHIKNYQNKLNGTLINRILRESSLENKYYYLNTLLNLALLLMLLSLVIDLLIGGQ